MYLCFDKNLKWKMCFIAIIFLFSQACTNKNSNIGFPGTNFEHFEIIFDSSVFETIYTYRDTTTIREGNSKLVLGNYDDAEARILLRFSTLPADTTFVRNPEITMFVNEKHNPQEIKIKVASLKDNLFIENQASWEKFNSTEKWNTPGGHFENPKEITFNFAEQDTFRFEIDKDLVKEWMRGSLLENYGIILFTENLKDSFIEFHSSETIYRSQISIFYTDDEGVEHIETRNVNNDTFIQNKNYFVDDPKDLYISNIPAHSVFTKLDFGYDKYKEIYNENGIFSALDLQRINVTQAFLVFYINNSNTMTTNNRFALSIGIPFLYENEPNEFIEFFDYNQMWHYPATADSLKNEKIQINIAEPMQRLVSESRPNNGLVILNNQRNMDFSHINLYNIKDGLNDNEPKMILRYAVLKEKK